jgi:hypothetical protein
VLDRWRQQWHLTQPLEACPLPIRRRRQPQRTPRCHHCCVGEDQDAAGVGVAQQCKRCPGEFLQRAPKSVSCAFGIMQQ